jgi:hypothetical protein
MLCCERGERGDVGWPVWLRRDRPGRRWNACLSHELLEARSDDTTEARRGADALTVVGSGEILGQHRDSTICPFPSFLAHLTNSFKRIPLAH